MKHVTSIKFQNYKSFKLFSISLNEFNILVGPNNSGKSTILGAFKILAEGIRKAKSKKPTLINDPNGKQVLGYEIDLKQVPIATENVFYNYDDSIPAIIRFRISDGSFLQIFFPSKGLCFMNYESENIIIHSPTEFKKFIGIEIGYVPILGPVEHEERLYQKEAARLALLTYRASRNFRNIWFHFGEDFQEFKQLVRTTWPGMDIEFPEVNLLQPTQTINMFCPEERIPREIFWAGFGFQVWCQMLTYIIKNKNCTIFLIDEPDIYLHSDLQRQLIGILKTLGPDIIIATHSTEMLCESEINDILIINKVNQSAKRIKDATKLIEIFNVLGSNLNPILTQIAKSKRVLFVEGKDFIVLSKFARLLNFEQVANRSDFAVVSIEGYNPTKLRAFKEGIEKTIGTKILSAVIFDRDYRGDAETKEELEDLKKEQYFAHIHSCKEIENFLLITDSINGAIQNKINEKRYRARVSETIIINTNELLMTISETFRYKTQAQLQSHRTKYERSKKTAIDDSTILAEFLEDFDKQWNKIETRLKLIPGKEFLSSLNAFIQEKYKISLTISNIMNNITKATIPVEIKQIIKEIDKFRKEPVINNKA